jgi:type I restriction-modification system DNA methylase subunit
MDISRRLTNALSPITKKAHGIFFTPTCDVKFLVDSLMKFAQFQTVLEPSCGSCEFVRYMDDRMTGLDIDCYEINQTIYEEIVKLRFNNNVTIKHTNYLQEETKRYDLVIGNPPYTCHIFFIKKALLSLNEGGHMLFVLPCNFLSSKSCDPMRRYIIENYTIKMVHIFDQSNYFETNQQTCAIIVQNTHPISNEHVSIRLSDRVVLNSENRCNKLRSLAIGSKTLIELGFKVSVGTVLWNTNKHLLTSNDNYARLIYSSDIVDNKLSIQRYSNRSKLNFIKREGLDKTCIVVNRGYGSSKYAFRYALIMYDNYLIENHLLVVTHDDDRMTSKLYDCLGDTRTIEFISTYCQNNAISVSELGSIVPIFIA